MPSHRSLLLLFLTGCGPSRSASSAVHVDTLPNGALHILSDAPRWKEGEGWKATRDLAIGGADSGPGDLADVRGLAIDALGRIYVLDAQSAQIQVFDASGRHVRTIGRKGGGPGEFTGPIGIAIHGSRLVVVDQQAVRITLFDTSGSVIATHPRVFANIGVGVWEGGLDTAGTIIEQLGQWPTDGSGETIWSLAPLDSVSFTPSDTFPLPVFRGKVLEVVSKSGGGTSRATAIPPYSPSLNWVFDPHGYVWFGTSDKYQIVQRRYNGDTVRVIERAWVPTPVPDSARKEALAMMDWFTRQGGTISLSDISTTEPAFGRLVIDEAGNLWAGPYSYRASTWQVFDAAGQWLGPVSFTEPVSFLTFHAGRFYAAVHDSLGVVRVVSGTVQR